MDKAQAALRGVMMELEDAIRGRRTHKAYAPDPVDRETLDALFDLATPAMGHPPLVRIAVLDGDGTAAYRLQRASLAARLSPARLL